MSRTRRWTREMLHASSCVGSFLELCTERCTGHIPRVGFCLGWNLFEARCSKVYWRSGCFGCFVEICWNAALKLFPVCASRILPKSSISKTLSRISVQSRYNFKAYFWGSYLDLLGDLRISDGASSTMCPSPPQDGKPSWEEVRILRNSKANYELYEIVSISNICVYAYEVYLFTYLDVYVYTYILRKPAGRLGWSYFCERSEFRGSGGQSVANVQK